INLEFARDRLAFLFPGSKALLQADLGETAAPGNSISAVVIVIIIVPQDGIVACNAYYRCNSKNCRAKDRPQDKFSARHPDLRRCLARECGGCGGSKWSGWSNCRRQINANPGRHSAQRSLTRPCVDKRGPCYRQPSHPAFGLTRVCLSFARKQERCASP